MICPNCLKEIPDNLAFCPACGATIKSQAADAEVQRKTLVDRPTAPQTTDISTIESADASEKKKPPILSILMVLLLLVNALGVGYLALNEYRQSNATETLDSTNRVLIVEINSDLTEEETSDSIQIQNALRDGGTMRVNLNSLDSTLEPHINDYGAADASGNYWVLGALLNYVSSEGWELVDTPSQFLSEYYFVKH